MIPKINFRALNAKDVAVFFSCIRDNEASFSPWLDTPARVTSLIDAEREVSLSIFLDQRFPARFGLFDAGTLVGSSKCFLVDKSAPDIEIGFWIGGKYRSQGLGMLLLSETLKHVFNEMRPSRVTLRCADKNIHSQKLIESVGAISEGTIRNGARIQGSLQDCRIYGILIDEFRGDMHGPSRDRN